MKQNLRFWLVNILLITGALVVAPSCKKKKDEATPTSVFAVTTSAASGISGAKATLKGEVTGDGGNTIIERGFCGDLSPNPVVTNQNKIKVGSGVGAYTNKYNGFLPNTHYYVRAYAINSNQEIVYGNQIQFTTTDLEVGDNYGGGMVFYLDPSSTSQAPHGLIVAPEDINHSFVSGGWGVNTVNVTTNTTNGSGQANTTAILNAGAASNTAAYLCDSYTSGGYSDWYLPSKDELVLISTNLTLNNLGNMANADYWTSCQPSSPSGMITPQELGQTVSFPSGGVSAYIRTNNYPYTRAIRSY